MKNLIASVLCLLLLLIPWLIYDRYSVDTLGSFNNIIEQEIIPALEKEDWDSAEKSFNNVAKDWERFENISEFFLDTQAVSEVDELLYKTKYHIKMHDSSNAAASSAELTHMLSYLHQNEGLSVGNIF